MLDAIDVCMHKHWIGVMIFSMNIWLKCTLHTEESSESKEHSF